MKVRVGLAGITFVCFVLSLAAQNSNNTSASVSVPPVIQFSSVATDESGTPISGSVPISFSLYNSAQGGTALWTETQTVTLDNSGHYSVYLGLTQTNGVPATLFTSGEAHWLGVTITGQPEQPRVFLVSVPYAMKAGDAATVGGLPPSAFVLAAPVAGLAAPAIAAASSETNSAPPPSGAITGSGTLDFIPLWDTASDIISSVLFQSGTGSTAKIGINTTTPASTLDIKGGSTVRGTLSLPATGTATATKGDNSQPITLAASAFNSSTSKAVPETFQWQAEPTGNDTSTPGGTLNLLFGQGTSKPAETGLHIASNGQITFATGQAFPGTGDGTITGVTAGTGLSGGGSSGGVTLNLASNACAAGSAISALPFTCLPFATLGANTFSGNQTVNGNLAATGTVSGSSYQIGSSLFAFGTPYNSSNGTGGNALLGFAGNTTMSGGYNTASGYQALYSNTGSSDDRSGSYNTASGSDALYSNTTGTENTAIGSGALFNTSGGSLNTAVGVSALFGNTTGSNNTGLGFSAGNTELNTTTTGSNNTFVGAFANSGTQAALNNATAIGYSAQVTESNALVLGSINQVNGAAASVNVGIGTTTPKATLDVEGNLAAGSAPTLWLKNNAALQSGSTGNSVDIRFTPDGGGAATTPNAYIRAQEDGSSTFGTSLSFGTVSDGNSSGAIERMIIASNGNVFIGTTAPIAPTNLLTLSQTGGHAIAAGWDTYSSRRWKTNIHPLTDALSKVERLRGVSYDLKSSGKHEIGVIAEEVGAIVPEVVTYEENGKDARGVDYSRLTALLIEAVKQQQKQIAAQENQIKRQQRLASAQSAEIRKQRQLLDVQQRDLVHLHAKVGVLEISLHTAGETEKSSASSGTVKTATASLFPSSQR